MQYEEILALVREVARVGLSNFEYTEGNIHIAMSGPQGHTPVPYAVSAAAVSAPVAETAESVTAAETLSMPKENVPEQQGTLVTSPLVGTFYVAPAEDAPAFVQVGDTVKKGQVLGIVEAMKLMNEIESECDGVVTEILVGNEDMVEYGQPLVRIREH